MGASWMLDPKRVLVFNGNRTLIAIVRSVRAAAEFSKGNMQAIANACSGQSISSNGFYFRHFDPNVLVEMEDIDTLKLNEYDDLCGVEREYHTVFQMSRNKRRSNGEILEPIKRGKKTRKHKYKTKKRTKKNGSPSANNQ